MQDAKEKVAKLQAKLELVEAHKLRLEDELDVHRQLSAKRDRCARPPCYPSQVLLACCFVPDPGWGYPTYIRGKPACGDC